MSKYATKAAGNMFCQARYEAAKFNERLSSREGAAEELGVDRTRLARIELAEQANIHQDRLFAESYFKAGAWKNELSGVDTTSPSTNEFIKFSNANSDPIAFIDSEKTGMNQQTGRMPNRLGLGINVFNALKVHPAILERVKYGGSTANPASVTENVLAQLFGVEKIVVLKSIMNSASMGADEDMQYIGDPDAFLLAYATNAPSIDEPSAGYIFTWDMLGNGQMLPILNYLGENGTHTEYVEGLMATNMSVRKNSTRRGRESMWQERELLRKPQPS